jgi:hypothetical protein
MEWAWRFACYSISPSLAWKSNALSAAREPHETICVRLLSSAFEFFLDLRCRKYADRRGRRSARTAFTSALISSIDIGSIPAAARDER